MRSNDSFFGKKSMRYKSRYRSQAGILYDILKTLYEEEYASPTRLMYGARLPYDRLKSLLSQLEENGLIEKFSEGDRIYYRLTRKGYEALEELKRVKKLLDGIGIRF